MYKHGHSPRNGKRTYWYDIYKNIEMRTSNPNNSAFDRYQGKNKFKSFKDFIAYAIPNIGERPYPLHSIDRINTYGYYEPKNIRWATDEEQALNRKPWGKGSVWRGVFLRPARNGRSARFEAQIQINGKQKYLGSGDELKCRELFLEAYYNHHKTWPPEYKPLPIKDFNYA
jgi:hypothetical protein